MSRKPFDGAKLIHRDSAIASRLFFYHSKKFIIRFKLIFEPRAVGEVVRSEMSLAPQPITQFPINGNHNKSTSGIQT